MKKNLILIVLCLFTLLSCRKDEPAGLKAGVWDTDMTFLFLDENGDNLLNERVFYGLKLFEVVDGVEKEILNAGDYTRRGMTITQQLDGEHKGQIVLGMTVNKPTGTNKRVINRLKWTIGEGAEYTIQSEIEQMDHVTTITKVWLDGEVVWDAESSQAHHDITGEFLPRLIVVIK